MAIRVAINGYGRIGRNVLRALYENQRRGEFEIVAVNASGDLATNAHLTKFDTVHGRFSAEVSHDEKNLIVNGDVIPFFSTRNPAELPWGELKVDVVLECTGSFTSKAKCQAHLDAGAKKVLIPITSAAELGTVPSDLIGAFSLIFYSTPQEAVFKALGVE